MSTVGGWSRYQLAGPGGPERDLGPDCIAYVFVFSCSAITSWQYNLPLSDQAPSHSETEREVADFFFLFHRDPNLLSASLFVFV
jgi:hypothetical protein